MSKRGQAVAEGFVNFPMGSAEYPMGGGGGLVVKLVVLDEIAGQAESLGCCVGASVFDYLQEVLVGDDKRPEPNDAEVNYAAMDANQIMAHMDNEAARQKEWIRFHFPNYGSDDFEAGMSRHYRASIVLGSSGWTGFSLEKGHWYATFDSLTEEGKALYQMMEKLNPGCAVHLLTFLDT